MANFNSILQGRLFQKCFFIKFRNNYGFLINKSQFCSTFLFSFKKNNKNIFLTSYKLVFLGMSNA